MIWQKFDLLPFLLVCMSRLSKQAFLLTLEKASHLGGAMLLLIAVARLMGEAALGDYAYVIAITAVFVPILDLGLNTRVIRAVAAGEGVLALQDAVAFKMRFGVIAVMLMLVCSWWAGKPTDVIWAVLLVGVSTWAMSVGDVFNAVFKGLQRADYSALLVGGAYVCLTGLGIAAMVFGFGLLGIALAYAVCRIGFMFAAWILLGRVGFVVETSGVRWSVVLAGVQLMPAVFFIGVLLNINFITADALGEGVDSGVYAIGYRVGAALFVLVSASMEGVLPALVGVSDNRGAFRDLFWRCCGLFLVGGVVGVGLIQAFGYWAVVWIFGLEYVGAVTAVQVLGWILPPLLVCAVAHTALLALGREGEGFGWMVGLVVVGTLFGGFGFWWQGAMGAAMAPTVTGWLFACLLGGRVWRLLAR